MARAEFLMSSTPSLLLLQLSRLQLPASKREGSLSNPFSVLPAARTFQTDPGCYHFSVPTAISLTDCHRYLLTGFLASSRAAPENLFKRGAKLPCAQSIPVAFCFSGVTADLFTVAARRPLAPAAASSLSSSSPSPCLPLPPLSLPPPPVPHYSLSSSAPLPGVPGHCLQFRLTLSGSPSLNSLSNTVVSCMHSF